MSSHYLDFSSCRIVPGFCKSGHIFVFHSFNQLCLPDYDSCEQFENCLVSY